MAGPGSGSVPSYRLSAGPSDLGLWDVNGCCLYRFFLGTDPKAVCKNERIETCTGEVRRLQLSR